MLKTRQERKHIQRWQCLIDMAIGILFIIIFSAGLLIGYVARVFIVRKTKYAGTILVVETPEKTIFSLELDDDPSYLEDMDEVMFKISKHPTMTAPSQDNHGL